MQTLKGVNITMYGGGQQSRNFCYVNDLIEGMLRIMERPADLTGLINIGSPSNFTMLGLAEKVLSLAGGKSKFEFRLLPTDDPKQRQLNIGLAERSLESEPTVGLEDGLKETIANFKKPLKKDV